LPEIQDTQRAIDVIGKTAQHTLSFQARPFYEARGYQLYGRLEDFPAGSGHTRYYLTKPL